MASILPIGPRGLIRLWHYASNRCRRTGCTGPARARNASKCDAGLAHSASIDHLITVGEPQNPAASTFRLIVGQTIGVPIGMEQLFGGGHPRPWSRSSDDRRPHKYSTFAHGRRHEPTTIVWRIETVDFHKCAKWERKTLRGPVLTPARTRYPVRARPWNWAPTTSGKSSH